MKRLCSVLVAALVFTFSADASVTLQECRDKARGNYPLVRKYDLIRATKECNVRNASLSWLPRIELGVGGAWTNNVNDASDLDEILGNMASMMDLTGKQQQLWQYRVGATVTQTIWDGGVSAIGKKTSEAMAEKDEAELEVSLYELQRQVDEVYFSILLLEERLKQTEGRISVLQSIFAKMKSIYDEGGVSMMDLKSMEAEVKSASQQMKLIETNIKSSRLSLSLLTSIDLAGEQLTMPAEPDMIPMRPEYALIESNRRLLKLQMKKLDVDLLPKIGFIADAYYGYPGRNLFKSLTDHNPSFNATLGFQLKFSLDPLYTRKNDKALISQKMLELDIQKDMLDFKTRLSNTGTSQKIVFLRQTLEDDSEILQLRTDVRKAAEERLDNGVIDASDLLQKINEESNASLQKSIHLIELLQALYSQENMDNE